MCLLILWYTIHLATCAGLEAVSYAIYEELPSGTYIGNPVQDAKYPPLDRRYRLSLISFSNHEVLFNIDNDSMKLTTATRIDREALCSGLCELYLEVNVEIWDADRNMYRQGIPIPFTLRIIDINDNRPEVPKISLIVSEDAEAMTEIGTITATDNDLGQNSEITFTYGTHSSDEVKKLFDIGEKTGKVILKESLDGESRSGYIFEVKATDNGDPPLWSEGLVTVEVADVNDAPDISFITLDGSSTATVPETAPIGSLVALVKVTDADSGPDGQFDCNVQGTTFTLEPIEGMSGLRKVKLAAVLNREDSALHEVNVTCTDHAAKPLSSSGVLTVKVEE